MEETQLSTDNLSEDLWLHPSNGFSAICSYKSFSTGTVLLPLWFNLIKPNESRSRNVKQHRGGSGQNTAWDKAFSSLELKFRTGGWRSLNHVGIMQWAGSVWDSTGCFIVIYICCHTSANDVGKLASCNVARVKRTACHILLQKCLQLSTWDTDRLMSSPETGFKQYVIGGSKELWVFLIVRFDYRTL